MKGGCSPEYALSLYAAEVTGRPVRWTSERSEGLLTDEHEPRQRHVDTDLGARQGRQIPRAPGTINAASIGAYFSSERPTIPLTVALGCLVNTYTFPAIHAAGEGGFDQHHDDRALSRRRPARADLRDRNDHRQGGASARDRARRTAPAQHHPGAGDALHHAAASRSTIPAISARTSRTRWRSPVMPTCRERRAEARKRGKILGFGVATAVAATGGRDYEFAEVRFDASAPSRLITGSMDHGQGHGTVYKQVLSEKLGIDADLIRYEYGDTDLVTHGVGSFGSRSAILAGGAITRRRRKLIEKGKKIAAHMMEAAVERHRFEKGKFAIAGTDKSSAWRKSQAIPSNGASCRTTSRSALPRAPITAPPTPRLSRSARISARSKSTRRPASSR